MIPPWLRPPRSKRRGPACLGTNSRLAGMFAFCLVNPALSGLVPASPSRCYLGLESPRTLRFSALSGRPRDVRAPFFSLLKLVLSGWKEEEEDTKRRRTKKTPNMCQDWAAARPDLTKSDTLIDVLSHLRISALLTHCINPTAASRTTISTSGCWNLCMSFEREVNADDESPIRRASTLHSDLPHFLDSSERSCGPQTHTSDVGLCLLTPPTACNNDNNF